MRDAEGPLPDRVSHDASHRRPPRWWPTIAVGCVAAAFLAGLPLVELALDPPKPDHSVPVTVPSSSTSGGRQRVVTFEPPLDWIRVEDDDVVVFRDGAVSFTVERLGGACSTVMEAAVEDARAEEPSIPGGPGRSFGTEHLTGTIHTWSGPTTEGLLFTACEGSTGVAVLARGPIGSLSSDDFAGVVTMLDSLEVR